MTLYERIFEISKEKNINGKQLGEMLGLKKSPMTDWKNGKAQPTVEQIIKMCDIFATSADYLLFGKEKENLNDRENQLLKYFNLLSNEEQCMEIKKMKLMTEIYKGE